MANEKAAAAKPTEAAAGGGEGAAPKKGGMMKMIMAGGIVVALEVVTVVVTMMMAGGPKKGMAEPPATAPAEAVVKDVEVVLIDNQKLPNKKSGQLYMYDLSIYAKTDEKNKVKLSEAFKDHEAELKDRIRTIVASTDTQSWAEPGLETLRRQIMYELQQDLEKEVGKDVIKEVLIPKCNPIRAEY